MSNDFRPGDVAQLGERRLCKPEVAGSSPVVSIDSLLVTRSTGPERRIVFFYKLICRCVGLYNIIPNRLFAAEAKSLLNMSAQ